jgi:hypothetical protein
MMFFRTRQQRDNGPFRHPSPTNAQRSRDTVAIRSASGNGFDPNPPTLAAKQRCRIMLVMGSQVQLTFGCDIGSDFNE